MKTTHDIVYGNAKEMKEVMSKSVDLVITSPPYPMIEMWDEMYGKQSPEVVKALKDYDGNTAFELMHKELDKVWMETFRVLKDGGIACINIGDATRTLNKKFQIYPNHARILNYCLSIGFDALPDILWIKETNKPNKFIGSGMLPVGAYVTLEHEHILILRKGNRREFTNPEEKANRQRSAIFWEERNIWYSDLWKDINGIFQELNHTRVRERSAAFPIELVYRLINMFSVQGDLVLDPFLGTGTTTLGAIASARNSIGYELDENFREIVEERISEIKEVANAEIDGRLERHKQFIKKRTEQKREVRYRNVNYSFSVVTSQEREIYLPRLESIHKRGNSSFEIVYSNPLISTTMPSPFFS